MEVVEPSVHPYLKNEIWPVLLCFSGPTHHQIGDFWLCEKNFLNFPSGLWWRKDIERVSSTLTISVGLGPILQNFILSYLVCPVIYVFYVLELSIISCLRWKNFNLFFSKLMFYRANALSYTQRLNCHFIFIYDSNSYSNVNLK